jgi:predicted nucleotidyltransferase
MGLSYSINSRTSSVEQYLGSPAKIRILTTLYAWKGSELTERQLAVTCGISTFGLRHALKDLEKSHLVTKKTVGRSNVWLLNEGSFHFEAIKPILEIILAMPSPIKILTDFLRTNMPTAKIDRVVLFGSAAEGDLNQAGDVDIAILLKKVSNPERVKEVIQEKADALSGEFLSVVGKRLEPLVFSREDWDKVRKKPLGQSIMKGKELFPHANL